MTTAEYFLTPESVLPRELAYGVLRVADAPTVPHQRVVGELFLSMTRHVRERRLGEVLVAPVDVVLDAGAALVVQPDLLFISSARRALVGDRIDGAPDLVVEVLSPHPRIGELNEKIGWYAGYGVRECWLASIPKKEIAVLTLSDGRVSTRALYSGNQRISSEMLGELPISPRDVFGW